MSPSVLLTATPLLSAHFKFTIKHNEFFFLSHFEIVVLTECFDFEEFFAFWRFKVLFPAKVLLHRLAVKAIKR